MGPCSKNMFVKYKAQTVTRQGVSWAESKRKYPIVAAKGGPSIRLKLVRGKDWHGEYVDRRGRRRQVSLDTQSIETAKIVAKELSSKLADGTLPTKKKTTDKSPRDIFNEYVALVRSRLRPSTIEGYISQIERFLAHTKTKDLRNIRGADIQRYKGTITVMRGNKDERKAVPVSATTADRHAAGLSVFFDWARRMGYIDQNPCKDVQRVARTSKIPGKHLDAKAIRKLLGVTGAFRMAIHLSYFAGIRWGEILALHWSDVKLPRSGPASITIQAHPAIGFVPKSHHCRTVPVHSRLAKLLKRTRKADRTGLVWSEGQSWWNNKPWRKMIEKLGLDDKRPDGRRRVTPHALRHSFASILHDKGVPLRTIKEWCGHSSIQTTMIYVGYVAGHEKEIEKLTL